MRRDLVICVFLVAATLAAYGQVARHDFVNFDDNEYVYENPHVRTGLTWDGVAWAFTTMQQSNWHPLTWLSHMLDCQFFGLKAGYHHLVNVFLHILNSVLLYLVLKRMTGALWRSAMVAALFALHPLHVESVAWVSERKDVLSTLFLMLTLWAYAHYAARPSQPRYGLVFGFLALGLMAKPMLVTVPFVLLLLDYWPLGRLGEGDRRETALRLVLEKVPFLVLVAASSVVTFVAQQRGGAMSSMEFIPLTSRIENALVSYVAYMGKMLWPGSLAVFYPHRGTVPAILWLGAAATLVGISVFVIWAGRRRYLAVGWLWYLGTLVPVIGLVQVGAQSMADRYTYVPLIGLFVMAVWGVGDLVARRHHGRMALGLSASVVIIGCMAGTWLQAGHWQNGITLFEHTLKVTTGNALAHNNLGTALVAQERLEEAMAHYQKALRINPQLAVAHHDMGEVLARQGKQEEAVAHYQEALRINPDYAQAHNDLAIVLAGQGRREEAVVHLRAALRINPLLAQAHNNLGILLAGQGEQEQAIEHLRKALRINPQLADANYNLGVALVSQGKPEEAIIHYRQALRINPLLAQGHLKLGIALAQQGGEEEAIEHLREAMRLHPEYPEAHISLALALAEQGNLDEAIVQYREAIRLKSDDLRPYNNLAWILATHPDPRLRNGAEAVTMAERACRLSGYKHPSLLGTLAAAYAEAGRFPEALETAQKAIDIALSAGWKEVALETEKQLQHYKEGRPCREAQ